MEIASGDFLPYSHLMVYKPFVCTHRTLMDFNTESYTYLWTYRTFHGTQWNYSWN